ncbi:hypothetical protein [Pseudonocardia hydrocarbonoxydans]
MPHGFRALLVYVSVRVQEHDRIYRPVADLLSSGCHRLDSVDTVEDHTMMGYEANELIYSIWPECPGPLVPHGCVSDRVRVQTR